MKYFIVTLVLLVSLVGCNSAKPVLAEDASKEIISENTFVKNDTIRIANDELEYEIIIIEPGFQAWLATQPPMGHYGISFLENRNRRFVLSFNDRVNSNNSRLIYEQEINYNYTIHYGLEVNYLLYNYFLFFQKTYQQKL